jgi:hypothetical protein
MRKTSVTKFPPKPQQKQQQTSLEYAWKREKGHVILKTDDEVSPSF